ncbi:hypothetical protein [Delftia tsuruhatensis]|uniref:hypothetical protein n=1 Tax=Delftia tsuruhatensis TaxID=180282 RepID=UPI001E6B5AA5|nr:hypothetical protein [Delftia tsuruhatensis]CAC9681613.1 YD repeat (two copies) [Delftia tsuruhatensis]
MQLSGATSTSYTYDANGNRLTQTQTRGAGTTTTRYHWNAQDQLVSVAQDSGSGPEILARYRYNAANLRAEKTPRQRRPERGHARQRGGIQPAGL